MSTGAGRSVFKKTKDEKNRVPSRRQIRKMCEAVGCEVTRLHRLAVGAVEIGDLEVGGVRRLEGPELAALQEAVSSAAATAATMGGGGDGGSDRGEFGGVRGEQKRRVKSATVGWGARIAAEAEEDIGRY